MALKIVLLWSAIHNSKKILLDENLIKPSELSDFQKRRFSNSKYFKIKQQMKWGTKPISSAFIFSEEITAGVKIERSVAMIWIKKTGLRNRGEC